MFRNENNIFFFHFCALRKSIDRNEGFLSSRQLKIRINVTSNLQLAKSKYNNGLVVS